MIYNEHGYFNTDLVCFDFQQGKPTIIDDSIYKSVKTKHGIKNKVYLTRKLHQFEIFYKGVYWATINVKMNNDKFPSRDAILVNIISTYPGFIKHRAEHYLITHPFPLTLDNNQPTPVIDTFMIDEKVMSIMNGKHKALR